MPLETLAPAIAGVTSSLAVAGGLYLTLRRDKTTASLDAHVAEVDQFDTLAGIADRLIGRIADAVTEERHRCDERIEELDARLDEERRQCLADRRVLAELAAHAGLDVPDLHARLKADPPEEMPA